MSDNNNNYKYNLNSNTPETLFTSFKYLYQGHALTGFLVAVLFWNRTDNAVIISWLVAGVLVFIMSVMLAHAFNSDRLINRSSDRAPGLFNINLIACGILWSVLGLYFFLNGLIAYSSIILFIAAILSTVSAILLCTAHLSFICFSYPAVLPLAVCYLSHRSFEINLTGMMVLLLLAGLTVISRQLNKAIVQSLNYRRKNEIELQIKDQEKEFIVQLNTDLMNEFLRQKAIKEELKFENERAEEQTNRLKTLSTIDSLTGISNRRHFDSFLEKEWGRSTRNNSPLSLVLCDIDYFKAYNDHYGHQTGDECLVKVARLLAEYARRGGDLAARYGGEEFSIILTETDTENAAVIAEQMRQGIEELSIEHDASEIDNKITACFGVASIIPTNYLDSTDLISKADRALYKAKQSGKNSVVTFNNINELSLYQVSVS